MLPEWPEASPERWSHIHDCPDATLWKVKEENRARLKAALDKRNAVVAQANQNYVDLWKMPLLTDADLAAIAPFQHMWAALGDYFQDPRLRQLFGRYATYCGSSPYLAPATLMLVAHAEQAGVWTVDGGMHRIASTMAALLTRLGGRIRYDSPVVRLQLDRKSVV